MLEKLRILPIHEENTLKIKLDGYFLMSEVELMFQIIKRESRKLRSGFAVLIDIRNLYTASKSQDHIISKIEKVVRLQGSGVVSYSKTNDGINSKLNTPNNFERVDSVGLYS